MPSNVEIKASVANPQHLHQKASELSGSSGTIILQEDTFFNAPQGRLKLRQLQNQPSQLIYYERADKSGPKKSDYNVTETHDPESLKETLRLALGIKGSVKKKRYLYMVGQTRVHVDEVEGLGNFMELEVELRPEQTAEEGQTIANDLMGKLGIKNEDLITGAYMDLLLKK